MSVSAQRRGTKPPETRRSEILQAAIRLFDEAGYDQTTVQHIAQAAGVAAGTVYLYFPSKEHVLITLHAEVHAGIETALQSTFDRLWQRVEDAGGPDDASLELMVDAMVDTVVQYVRDNHAMTSVVCRFSPRLPAATADDQHHQTAAYLAAALQLGRDRGRVEVSDPEMAAQLLEASLTGPLSQMVVAGDAARVDRLAAQAKEFFVKALAPRR